MKRSFFLQDDASNKFWIIEVNGKTATSQYGKVGTKGRTSAKSFDDKAAALKFANQQIQSKTRKGYVEGEAPSYEAPDWASMPMNEETFWRLIGLFDWSKRGDDDAVMRRAFVALSSMPTQNLEGFEEELCKALYAIDTRAHYLAAEHEGYVSDDSFLYARAAAISSGESFYKTVVADPNNMPTIEYEFEALLELANSVYEETTGEDAEFTTSVSYETGSNTAGWPEDK